MIYTSTFNYLGRQTPGKHLCGIAVVNNRTGSRQLHWCQPLVRVLVSCSALLDLAWGIFQRHGRCLHDVVAGTIVINDE